MLCSTAGHNYDMDSWVIVADLQLAGKSVYAETMRYNYGPFWFYILAGLKLLAGSGFRYAIGFFLSLVDVAIGYVFLRRGNGLVACLYMLSPIAIILTGYHCQFDNFAILIALLAVVYAEKKGGTQPGLLDRLDMKRLLLFSIIIGLSLVLKHIFIFLPFWLFFQVQDWRRRLLVLCLPGIIFLASFLPYAHGPGLEGIVRHVFLYTGGRNAPLFRTLFPLFDTMDFIPWKLRGRIYYALFVLVMLALGVLFRRQGLLRLLLLYTAALVLFASNIHTEYFMIPVLFTLVYRNAFSLAYQAFGILLLLVHRHGLHLLQGYGGIWEGVNWFFNEIGIFIMVLLLLGSFLSVMVKRQSKSYALGEMKSS